MEDAEELHGLVQHHLDYTGSANAKRILEDWNALLPKFVKVYPQDYRRVIEARKRTELEIGTRG
jgi:glutamate synthase domain-containing protein 3